MFDLPYLDKWGHLKMFPRGQENVADDEGYIPAKAIKDADGKIFYVPAAQPGLSGDNASVPQSQTEGLPPGAVPRQPQAAPLPNAPYAEFGGIPLTEPEPSAPVPTLKPRPNKTENADASSNSGADPYAEFGGVALAPRSLPNGTVLRSQNTYSAKGYLDISNGSQSDGVLKLVSEDDDKPLEIIYIRANQKATIYHIKAGKYRALFARGFDWDPVKECFTRDAVYKKFAELLDFDESDQGDSIEYAHYSLTLYPVENGNARTHEITEEEFRAAGQGRHLAKSEKAAN